MEVIAKEQNLKPEQMMEEKFTISLSMSS